MAGGKETPRQKMIGMMYLVLTALLALNISKDILNAFVLVNQGMEKTVESFEDKNSVLYAEFSRLKALDENRYAVPYQKAMEAQQASENMVQYIHDLKVELIMAVEGIPREVADTIDLMFVNGKDNYDIPTNIMIGDSHDGSAGKSKELREKMESYQAQLKGLLSEQDLANLSFGFDFSGGNENGAEVNWEVKNFDHTQLAPTVVLLSKLQNDVRNAEYDVVSMLLGESDKEDFIIDTIAARVLAPTNYVLLGEEYKADVIIAGFSTSQNPDVFLGQVDENGNLVGQGEAMTVENGIGKYTVPTNAEGQFSYTGVVKVKNKAGDEKVYPFESSYIVARPSATVAATKMQVFYKGVENPIKVSVPGVANDKIRVSMSGGTVRRTGDGEYMVKLNNSAPRTVTIKVSAEMENGEVKPMGNAIYTCKVLPRPFAKVGGREDGCIPLNEMMAAQGVRTTYGADFLFQGLSVSASSFELTIIKGGQVFPQGRIAGNRFKQEHKEIFRKLRPGDRVIIENIKAKGSDGITHKLGSVSLKIC